MHMLAEICAVGLHDSAACLVRGFQLKVQHLVAPSLICLQKVRQLPRDRVRSLLHFICMLWFLRFSQDLFVAPGKAEDAISLP